MTVENTLCAQRVPLPWLVACLFAIALTISCGDTAEDTDGVDTPNECLQTTKCDGISEAFGDFYDDMRSISLDDLTILGVGLATEELNDSLEVDYATIEIEPTALYGDPDEVVGVELVHDIDELHAGLTERLGEEAFATRVNGIRRDTIDRGDAVVFAESHFTIGANARPSWSMDAGDVVGTVGFNAGTDIEAIVIAPYDDRVDGVTDNPLQAIKETRGFILPRDVEDVRQMAPGESLGMQARGAIGFNLGVGVPFYLGTIADYVTVHLRLSLGARAAVEGDLDVQLVRGEGDVAWVDVGVANNQVRHFSAAFGTGYGVAGLPEVDLDLGVVDVDVTNIAEKALSKQLNRRLDARISASSDKKALRLTVARFRFDLSKTAGGELEQALHQALKGDIRLAQALGNRPDTGVVQELDITKDARSEASYLGFRFLGMEFYRANEFRTGTVVIEADGQNQTLLFSELEDRDGIFFASREARWRKVVSLTARDGVLENAAVNTRLTLTERDDYLSRDQMLDNIDPTLGMLFAFDPFFDEASYRADLLAAYYDHECGIKPTGPRRSTGDRARWNQCIEDLPGSPEAVMLETDARQAYNELRNSARQGFDRDLVGATEAADQLWETKIALSNRRIDSPEGAMVTQVRFSHDALDEIFVFGSGEEFRQRLVDVYRYRAANRDDELDDKKRGLENRLDNREKRLSELADVFERAALDYRRYDEIAKASPAGETIGQHGSLVLIDRRNPEEVDLGHIVEHKGQILESLYPELVALAEEGLFSDIDETEKFVVGYALMMMGNPELVEMLINYTFDDDDFDNLRIYTKGTGANFIESGQFDLDELLLAE